MYRCNCGIGCLTGSVTRVGEELIGSATRADKELLGSITRIGFGLSGSITRIGRELSGVVSRNGDGLRGSVSLVCSIGKDAYLRVNPDVVWLTQDMLSGEFDIYSNVVWKID